MLPVNPVLNRVLLLRRSLLQLGADGGTPEALAAVLVLADQGKHAPAVFEGREGKGGKGQQLLQRRRVLCSGAFHEVTGHLCHTRP